MFKPNPINSAVGYFFAATILSRILAVLIVYPIAAMMLSSSISLNEVPLVAVITSILHGFLFAWTTFWFLPKSKPEWPVRTLLIVLAIIFFSSLGMVVEQIKSSEHIQYGSAEADKLMLIYAATSVCIFLVPYLLGTLVFKPLYKKWGS